MAFATAYTGTCDFVGPTRVQYATLCARIMNSRLKIRKKISCTTSVNQECNLSQSDIIYLTSMVSDNARSQWGTQRYVYLVITASILLRHALG